MKHTKRLLALAVALVLALTLALPAAAAVNWREFSINNVSQIPIISRGESFTLSVKANIPEWVDEVTYQWHGGQGYGLIEGATTNTLQVNPGDAYYPKAPHHFTEFFCSVTAVDNDEGQSQTLTTRQIGVRVKRTFGDKLYSVTLLPFAEAFYMSSLPFVSTDQFPWWSYPASVLGFPFFLLVSFIENIMGLSGH